MSCAEKVHNLGAWFEPFLVTRHVDRFLATRSNQALLNSTVCSDQQRECICPVDKRLFFLEMVAPSSQTSITYSALRHILVTMFCLSQQVGLCLQVLMHELGFILFGALRATQLFPVMSRPFLSLWAEQAIRSG